MLIAYLNKEIAVHENQKIINNMIRTAKLTLSDINDRQFTIDEVFDFIEDIIKAGYGDKAKKASGKKEDEVDKVFEKWSKK
tara:strand:- start:307 stop:549 length:243 start_codon:yes stop_codon:yes gene_type:complete